MKRLVCLLCVLVCLLCGCAASVRLERSCTVVFEDNDQTRMQSRVVETAVGSSLTVSVSIPAGQRISGVSYPGATVSPCVGAAGEWQEYRVTLPGVRYPTLVRLETAPCYTTVYTIQGETVSHAETSQRLTLNTLPWTEDLTQPDCIAVGWQKEDTLIGFGSRYAPDQPETTLEPYYLPCADARRFTYGLTDGEAVILSGEPADNLIIPQFLDGCPVVGIAAGAFGEVHCSTVVLPPTLRFMEEGAFTSLSTEELFFFDGLTDISDSAFGSLSVKSIHINAVQSPVYCGGYFDGFTEKMDYLASLAGEKKLVLVGGSSVRFGYDSSLLEAAFPEYRVVNLGVYAYAGMLPEIRLMEQYLREGDVVLSSPELDAIPEQFCAENRFSREHFAMVESNYDLLTGLDCREFTGFFDAFGEYQQARAGMATVSYEDIPAQYDEDGNPAPTLSYNRQGDYILYRESNLDGRLFGVKRACYNPDRIRQEDWEGLRRVYEELAGRGVSVYFTWSPRSSRSITEDSTADAIAALEEEVRTRLPVKVITPIQDSLMDARYFYGTDNHLTTEGAALRTRQVADALRNVMKEADP